MFERSKYLYTEEGYHCESLLSELAREFRGVGVSVLFDPWLFCIIIVGGE